MATIANKTNMTGSRPFRRLRAFVMSELTAMAPLIRRGLLHIGRHQQRTCGQSRMRIAINGPESSAKSHEETRRNTRFSTALRESSCNFVDDLTPGERFS